LRKQGKTAAADEARTKALQLDPAIESRLK
jgi:hypothetical protein